jgi:uncharacterized protein YjbI with pentapeptide repeats
MNRTFWKRTHLAIGIATSLTLLSVLPAQAENFEHTQQLLSTKQCAQCDLRNAGLAYARLAGANLTGANLIGANLSRADLQGVDLRGANLTGATLHGANLAGAKLDGAILQMTDLRFADITGITYEGAVLQNTLLQGAVGIPTEMVAAEEFYRIAVVEANQGNHPRAVESFSQAIARKPDLAPAYLGRAVSRVHMVDRQGAINDSQTAEQLFKNQGDLQSATVAQTMHKQLTAPPPKDRGGNGLGIALLNLAGIVLKFLAFF